MRWKEGMDFEKEHIILFIVLLIIGFIIGLVINTNNLMNGFCNKEQSEIKVLTKEINSCLNQLNQDLDINNTNNEQPEE
jgi:uncharacterized membrane protein YqgA involved in biofilm formation